MKHAKKLTSVLLAVVMLLAMATTAFAANNDGSITVRNATVDQTYTIYKVFDLTYSGNNVAYSYTKNGDPDTLLTALQHDKSPFTLTATQVADKYTVTVKDGQDAAAISTWLKENEKLLTETASTEATSDTVEFTGLAYGYYYVTSTLGSVVTIDSTLKDVKIIDKNQGPSWDNEPENPDPSTPAPGKVIVNADDSKTTVNSANYGDTVKFSIAVNAVAYAKNAAGEAKLVTYYHITDTLSKGFDDAQNIKVTVGDKELTADEYTLTQNGKTFSIDVPFGEKYGSNAVIEVTYSAVVNNNAVLAGEGNPNTANFTYTTDDDNDPTNPPYDPKDPTDPEYPDKPNTPPTYEDTNKKTTTTYVYALGVKKVDPQGNALQGAEFTVTDAIGHPITATGTNGVYTYSKDGDVTQFQTDGNGILLIKGLAAGDYSVAEVVAPNGYNLLKNPTTVTAEIDKTSTYTETITIYKDADGNVTKTETAGGTTETTTVASNVVPVVVVNHAGTELPSTGGMGTTLFYILGGLLAVGAATLLVVKKRMNRNAQ